MLLKIKKSYLKTHNEENTSKHPLYNKQLGAFPEGI